MSKSILNERKLELVLAKLAQLENAPPSPKVMADMEKLVSMRDTLIQELTKARFRQPIRQSIELVRSKRKPRRSSRTTKPKKKTKKRSKPRKRRTTTPEILRPIRTDMPIGSGVPAYYQTHTARAVTLGDADRHIVNIDGSRILESSPMVSMAAKRYSDRLDELTDRREDVRAIRNRMAANGKSSADFAGIYQRGFASGHKAGIGEIFDEGPTREAFEIQRIGPAPPPYRSSSSVDGEIRSKSLCF